MGTETLVVAQEFRHISGREIFIKMFTRSILNPIPSQINPLETLNNISVG
jgi:hypothetical protein